MKKTVFTIVLTLLIAVCTCACGAHRHGDEAAEAVGADNTADPFFSPKAVGEPESNELPRNFNGSEKTPDGKAQYFTIGYSALTNDDAFFVNVRQGLERACSAAGIELLFAVCDGNGDKMREAWKGFCERGADVIIDFNLNRNYGSVLTREIEEKYHVPVISVDERYNYAYFFGVDNERAGEMLGEFAAQKVKEKWNGDVDCLLQLYNENNGKLVLKRNQFVIDGLKNEGILIPEENIEWLSVVEPGGLISTSYIQPLLYKYMERHMDRELHILVSCYNDDAAEEVNRAALHFGRTSNIIIVSHNADPGAVLAMKAGNDCWLGSMNYQAEAYGAQLVVLAKKILSGADAPKVNYANIFIIDKDNVYDYFPD